MRLPFLALALLGVSAPAIAAPPAPSGDWRVVLHDREEEVGRIVGFADAGTARKSGSSVSFWLEYRLERGPQGLDGFRGYVTGDCSTYAYGSTDLSAHSGNRLVEQGGVETAKTAEPGTAMRTAIENVCAGRYLSGKTDPIAHARSVFAN